jgi:hypothetical protein
MRMRITVTDDDGWSLASHVFEIAGRHDYAQATDYVRKLLRDTLVNRNDQSSIELARKLEPTAEE